MAKPEINNFEDLMAEKKRLKVALKANKANINESFKDLKEELNPFSQVRKTAQSALKANTANPIVRFGIKRATDFLVGKVLLKRAGWLPRLIIPFAVRDISSRLIGHKADKKIAATLHNAADKIRNVQVPELGDEPH